MIYRHKSKMIFRKMEEQDAINDLLELKKESWWGSHQTLINNSDDQSKWYKSIPNNQLFMIGEYPEGTSVGVGIYTNIDTYSKSASLSGSVFKSQRSPVVVNAAFETGLDFAFEILNLQRVESEVLEYNVPSIKIQLNLGFTIEGKKRRSVYKSGRYYDSIILGMLRDEWLEQPRVIAMGKSCNIDFDHDIVEKLSQRLSQDNQALNDQLLRLTSTLHHQS